MKKNFTPDNAKKLVAVKETNKSHTSVASPYEAGEQNPDRINSASPNEQLESKQQFKILKVAEE